jgi:hypothetical protein
MLACKQVALQPADLTGRPRRLFERSSEDKNLESRFSGLDLTQPFEIPQSHQRNLWKNLALEPQKFGNALALEPKKFGSRGNLEVLQAAGDRRLADRRRRLDRSRRPTRAPGRRSLAELRISTERALYSPFFNFRTAVFQNDRRKWGASTETGNKGSRNMLSPRGRTFILVRCRQTGDWA